MNSKVNFKVLSIEKAMKKQGYVVARVEFDNNPKIYTFVRKAYDNTTVIDGCRITFDKFNYKVISIERLYETKGMKKKDTSGQGVTNKIKEEIKEKDLDFELDLDEDILEKAEEIKEEVKEESYQKGEVHHEKYEIIRTCLMNNIPVYLAGPAGSGKNHTVEQIAKELGWNFYFSNSVQQEYKLTGFTDAGGEFHETEFYKACTDESDCIFFLDEMDASIPEVLVLLNAAIANGYFEFPNGRVDFDHVHFVAAGNTVGSGADEMYTGRMVLDQATLDRFAIIEFDYSRAIEMAITKGNKELVDFIRDLRKKAEHEGIRTTFSYRCMTMVTKLEKSGMDLKTIMTISVVKGLDKDTINTLNIFGYTKYHKALKELQMAA